MLDPVTVPDDLTIYDRGTITNSANSLDYLATYVTMPHDCSVSLHIAIASGCIKESKFDST